MSEPSPKYDPLRDVEIQCKAPFTALSLRGLKLRFGETKLISRDDWRYLWWLERDQIEEVPKAPQPKKQSKKDKRGEKEL